MTSGAPARATGRRPRTRCTCGSQIVGKVRMASTAPRNHWWHVPLYVDVRGLTTRRMHSRAASPSRSTSTSSTIDSWSRRAEARSSRSRSSTGSRSPASTSSCTPTLRRLGVDVAIRETPYGVPMTTPFHDGRRACGVRPRCRRALLAHPRLDGRGLRGVRRLVLRQDEPRPPLLALASTSP